jgi:photosystem I subunit X
MLTSMLLAAVPAPLAWSPAVGIIMIVCNVIAIAFGKLTISIQNAPPALPSSNLFGGFGLPGLLGTTCFGHILGVGVILGLHGLGKI